MLPYPFLQADFLEALENSQSACAATGWHPRHQTLHGKATNSLQAFMPLYIKEHSYGEYVFDWAWADAYQRNRLAYYPKLLTAIPFTPATGPRINFADDVDQQQLAHQLIDNSLALAQDIKASSWHILFPNEQQQPLFNHPALMARKGVQYHWHNKNYQCFDDYLSHFNARKRKMVRKERKQVANQQLVIERHTGNNISHDLWQMFSLFYQRTYQKRSGSQGYLTPEFFQALGKNLGHQCLLVTASHQQQVVAAAFYMFDNSHLYGRYWGCLQEFDALHFELCYYQGIEFAIEKGLQVFDAGAQGEHKIVRGFEPVFTHSRHWIANPAFAEAIANFLKEEAQQMDQHYQQAQAMLPYKKT